MSAPQTMLDAALWAAQRGIRVFPIHTDSKQPVICDWPNKATRDEAQIRRWWKSQPDRNIGWVMGDSLPSGRFLVALDVDAKPGGADGEASLEKILAELGLAGMPATLTQTTPSGYRGPNKPSEGGHLILSSARPLANSAGALGPGLDVRGKGGYILGCGSTINGIAYKVADIDSRILPMPDAIEARLSAAVEPTAKAAPIGPVDGERAATRAIEYLRTAPLAVEGSGGDETTYKVAARLKDLGCTESQTAELMSDWNERCSPPWSCGDLSEKVAHAFRYGTERPGISAPEAVFTETPAADGETDDAAVHPIEALNREFAFVLLGGKDAVLWETHDADGRPSVEFLTVEAFNRKHAAKMFQSGNRAEPLTQAWMSSPKRRSYDAAVFKPGKKLDSRFFNLWKGFAVQPAAGDWSLMRQHIREVICSSDPALDLYLMSWLARMVQQPGTPGEVAMVIRGGKGTGKGTLGEYLCRMLGHHGAHISNAKHLVGNFNNHLRAAVFLFADEAFWAGDRQHEGVLKQLVSERQVMIEAKGRDAVNSDNCLHILMASNDAWVVPSSADERRFCVIDISDCRQQQNKTWFGPLRKQMDHGGLEAMLHDLLAHDISGFDVFDVPRTEALGDQKLHSLRGPERWLHDVLTEGSIGSLFAWQNNSSLSVAKAEAYAHYADRSRKLYGEHHPVDERWFWKAIRTALAKGGATLGDERLGAARVRKAVFPPLAESRQAFAAYLRTAVEWGEEPNIFE